MAKIRIVTTRAPGLIPSLIKEIDHAANPVVLIPESFTLACETEIVNRSRDKVIRVAVDCSIDPAKAIGVGRRVLA